MDSPAWRSRFRGSTFPSRLVHTPARARPALFSIAAALCLSACTTTAPLATQAPAASLASPTVLVPERYVSADNPGGSVEHTSELKALMLTSYAFFCFIIIIFLFLY